MRIVRCHGRRRRTSCGGAAAASSVATAAIDIDGVWFRHPTTAVTSARSRTKGGDGGGQDVSGDSGGGGDEDGFVLRDVSLRLEPGELGLLTGRSGSGKTTLLNVAAGFTAPDRGTVRLRSRTLAPASATRMDSVGYVFQFPERHFVADTLLAELAFGIGAKDDAGAMGRRVMDAMRLLRVDVNEMLGKGGFRGGDIRMRDLSGGYQRRVAIAIQVARRPDVLLMDEPLAGLDWRARASLVPALRDLASGANGGDGCAVLIVSHDIDELRGVVDRWWTLDERGRINVRK